jgi:hypothetical protein
MTTFRNQQAIDRLRPLLAAARAKFPSISWIPDDTLLAWIDKESGGNYKLPKTSLGEVGLFQVHPGWAKDNGWSDAKLASMSTDVVASMEGGLEMVAEHVATTVERFAKIGVARENIPDVLYFVKLYHGLPLLHKCATSLFKKRLGRGPNSFEEAAAFCESVAKEGVGSYLDMRGKIQNGRDWRAATPRILNNARKNGRASEGTRPPPFSPSHEDLVDAALRRVSEIGGVKPLNKPDLDAALRDALEKLNAIT